MYVHNPLISTVFVYIIIRGAQFANIPVQTSLYKILKCRIGKKKNCRNKANTILWIIVKYIKIYFSSFKMWNSIVIQ
jgi:hypothetical protein